MYDINAVLDWADAVCEDALHDPVQANRIAAQSKGLGQYFIEVVKLRSFPREGFPHMRPNHWNDIQRVYNEYLINEETKSQAAKVDSLEGKLERLEKQIAKLIEVQTPKQQQQIAEAATPATEDDDEEEPAQDDGDAQEAPEAAVEPDTEGEPDEADAE